MCLHCHERVVSLSAAFIFLSAIPYLDVEDLPSLDERCAICTVPYHEGHCQLDNPVKLRCGHTFGHQCLVRWMLSDNFDNQCAFCRAQIVDEAELQRSRDPHVSTQLAYFEIRVLDEVVEIQNPSNRKQQLLEHVDLYLTKINDIGCTHAVAFNKDRVVMIWEEFVEMVREKLEEDARIRDAIAGDLVRQLDIDRDALLEEDRLAAVGLEREQEKDRCRSRMKIGIPVIVGVAGVVIASQLGLW